MAELIPNKLNNCLLDDYDNYDEGNNDDYKDDQHILLITIMIMRMTDIYC